MGGLPRYKLPAVISAPLALSWLFQRKRSFLHDSRVWADTLSPAPQVSGRENIPANGPCLITFNHFHRPGFNILWLVLALGAVLPQVPDRDLKVIMTGEFTYPGKWYAAAGRVLSRYFLKRLAHVYGFFSMPPMPPRKEDVLARARTVRAALAWLEETAQPLLLMSPEGADQPGGCLARPPAGVGRFIALMADSGLPILPLGVWEQDGTLRLCFGELYCLDLPVGLARDDLDRAASEMVMRAIAKLLPAGLRGEFSP